MRRFLASVVWKKKAECGSFKNQHLKKRNKKAKRNYKRIGKRKTENERWSVRFFTCANAIENENGERRRWWNEQWKSKILELHEDAKLKRKMKNESEKGRKKKEGGVKAWKTWVCCVAFEIVRRRIWRLLLSLLVAVHSKFSAFILFKQI